MQNNIDKVIASLEQATDDLFNWSKNNYLKSNFDKCHLLVSRKKLEKKRDYTIDNSECEKLLGVKIGPNVIFDDHISD